MNISVPNRGELTTWKEIAKIQKCESGNPFCLKRKMDLKCSRPSGMEKVRVEKGEGRGIMQDASGLSAIQWNSNPSPQKKSNKVHQITNVYWASYLTPLFLNFLICKTVVVLPTTLKCLQIFLAGITCERAEFSSSWGHLGWSGVN